MLIRKMTEEDIEQVVEIEKECFSLPWSEKSFEDSLKREDTIFLVCEQEVCQTCEEYADDIQKQALSCMPDKKILGYIGMYRSFEEGEITNVAVFPFARKKGVGNRLINSLKEIAKKQNLERIVLEVRVSNQPAISLYEKNAFVSVGIRKNFYEKPIEDAKIMICEMA